MKHKSLASDQKRGRAKFANQNNRNTMSIEERCKVRGIPYEPIRHLSKSVQGTLVGNALDPLIAMNVAKAAWL